MWLNAVTEEANDFLCCQVHHRANTRLSARSKRWIQVIYLSTASHHAFLRSASHTLADANDVLQFLNNGADDEWFLLASEEWDDRPGRSDRECREGGWLGFCRVKMDDVTNGAGVIWGFEPMRDGVSAEGGMTGNAEGMIGFLASNWREILWQKRQNNLKLWSTEGWGEHWERCGRNTERMKTRVKEKQEIRAHCMWDDEGGVEGRTADNHKFDFYTRLKQWANELLDRKRDEWMFETRPLKEKSNTEVKIK